MLDTLLFNGAKKNTNRKKKQKIIWKNVYVFRQSSNYRNVVYNGFNYDISPLRGNFYL